MPTQHRDGGASARAFKENFLAASGLEYAFFIEWNGMEWNGMEWNRIYIYIAPRIYSRRFIISIKTTKYKYTFIVIKHIL